MNRYMHYLLILHCLRDSIREEDAEWIQQWQQGRGSADHPQDKVKSVCSLKAKEAGSLEQNVDARPGNSKRNEAKDGKTQNMKLPDGSCPVHSIELKLKALERSVESRLRYLEEESEFITERLAMLEIDHLLQEDMKVKQAARIAFQHQNSGRERKEKQPEEVHDETVMSESSNIFKTLAPSDLHYSVQRDRKVEEGARDALPPQNRREMEAQRKEKQPDGLHDENKTFESSQAQTSKDYNRHDPTRGSATPNYSLWAWRVVFGAAWAWFLLSSVVVAYSVAVTNQSLFNCAVLDAAQILVFLISWLGLGYLLMEY